MQKQTITKPGYKFIPNLGEIPEDWEFKNIGKYIIKQQKTNRLSSQGKTNGIYPFFNNSIKSYDKYIDEYDFDGEMIIANTGGQAYFDFYNGKFGAMSDCMVFSSNQNTKFFYYKIKYLEKKVNHLAFTGSGIKHLDKDYFNDIIITIPKDIKEQQKIAKILNTCDNQIEITKQIIQKIEIRNKGLQQQLLTGKKRLPGFSEDWSNKHLSEILDRVTRKNSEGNDNVLTISAQKGLINQENFFNKQVASKILDDYFLLYKGEFAYNKSYSNGYPMGAIKRLNYYDKGVVTTLYICFSIKENLNYSSNFFEKYFESGMLIKGLTQIAHEGGRAHGLLNVTPSDFFNLKVLIPNSKEQKAIADVLDKATEQLNEYKEKLEKLELQKKGLMQQLLTGKTRVKV